MGGLSRYGFGLPDSLDFVSLKVQDSGLYVSYILHLES